MRTAPTPVQPVRKSEPKTQPFDPARDKELREMHKDGILGRLLVADLRAACAHYGLPTSGKKSALLGKLGAYFSTN